MNKILTYLLLMISMVGYGQMKRGPFFTVSSGGQCVTVTPIIRYNCENNGNDESGNGYNHTVYQAQYTNSTALGGSYSLDCQLGTSHFMTVPNIDYGNNFVVFFGARRAVANSNYGVYSSRYSDSDGISFRIDRDNNRLLAYLSNPGQDELFSDATVSPAANDWNTYAFHFDDPNDSFTFYYNGAPVGTRTTTQSPTTTQQARIGQHSYCWIDCVQIYQIVSGDADVLVSWLHSNPTDQYVCD